MPIDVPAEIINKVCDADRKSLFRETLTIAELRKLYATSLGWRDVSKKSVQ